MKQQNHQRLIATSFNKDPVDVTRVDKVWQGYAKVERHTLSHQLFAGGKSKEIQREIFVSGDAVMIVPFDVKTQEILLVEQFRMAPMRRGDNPWMFEAIAGRIDKDEAPIEVARREAIEEAGCTLGEIEEIGGFFPSPGIFAEHMTFFCGQADLTQAGGIFGLDEEDEDIRALVVPLEEAMTAIDDGRIVNAPTTLCLLWLDRNKDRLTQKWQQDI